MKCTDVRRSWVSMDYGEVNYAQCANWKVERKQRERSVATGSLAPAAQMVRCTADCSSEFSVGG